MGSTIATISSAIMIPDMIRFVFVLCILNIYVYSSIRGILIFFRKSLGYYTCIPSLLQEIMPFLNICRLLFQNLCRFFSGCGMIADMKNELTQKDIDEMQQEIEYRKLVVRPKALEDVKETRAQGDLSENFEYHAAKKYKNQNESRIKYLERMIRTAVIIEDTVPPDVAGINKTVTIYLPEDREEEIYTLVSTVRGNSLKGLISVESPLGRALTGHKVGDRISVRVSPDYSYTAEIRKIEDAGSTAAEAKLTSF